jgi:tetratricopeptide (TPR) repeat protein
MEAYMSTTPEHAAGDTAVHVQEMLQRGITQVRAGEHAVGMSSFEEAGRLATGAGLTALAAGAAINRGWALALSGDTALSIDAYVEGADLAREADDARRLVIALGNLGIAYTAERRYEEAAAIYEEYIPLLEGDAEEEIDSRLNWSVALEGLGRADEASEQLDEAERVAVDADLDQLLVRVHIAQGAMRERAGEGEEALELYWKAFDIASEAEDADLVGTVTMTLGYAYTRARDHAKAADCFGEAARAFRHLEDHQRLAGALVRQGRAMQTLGLVDQALEVWREAEPLLREIDDQAALGECLLEQAVAVSGQQSNMAPDLQFTEAAAAFRAAGALDRLPEVFLTHAQWCRERALDKQARTHVDEALAALADTPDAPVEVRALGLKAQILADAGDLEGAEAVLASAESVGREAGDALGLTGVMARRAYLMARSSAPAAEVKAQLLATGEHARQAGHESLGRYAADAMATEIEERCGGEYKGLLDAPEDMEILPPIDGGVIEE